jgi:hypothetical protein
MAPSTQCSGPKNTYLAPAVGRIQEEWQQPLAITCADLGDIDIVEALVANVAKALTLAAGFQTKDLYLACRLALISSGNLGSNLSTLWLSDRAGSSPHLRPRDQFDLPGPPLPMLYVPLGTAFKVSGTVGGRG